MAIYLDNAATTPIDPEVVEAMIPILQNDFGNPSSTHSFGRSSKALIENSRRSIAKHINCESSELIFTSGGTEADNIALNSAIHKMGATHIITSAAEHHAVGHAADAIIQNNKIRISLVKLDEKGNVDLEDLERLLNSDEKAIVSLMHANNEISTLLPLKKVSQLCRKYNALFHSDTVQTIGHYPFDLQDLDIDFITCSAHKFHGPKGIGFLYAKKSNQIDRLIHGGAQERGLRGGTENIYGIVGLAKAMDLANENIQSHIDHVQSLKTHLMNGLEKYFDNLYYFGETAPEKSLYTVLNVSFPKSLKSSMLLFTLDLKGIAVSGGSACNSGAITGSHVLTAINADMTRPNVRFSFSRFTTREEIDFTLEQVKSVYEKNLV